MLHFTPDGRNLFSMKIKSITVSSPFKYLWLKSVEGVDLTQHCARCIVGKSSKAVSNTMKEAADIELGDGIYYLCGVALPYNWNRNFHLAICARIGHNFTYEHNGIRVEIEDGEPLPISPEYIDAGDKHANTKAFNTCRNWQFAHYYAKHLGVQG